MTAFNLSILLSGGIRLMFSTDPGWIRRGQPGPCGACPNENTNDSEWRRRRDNNINNTDEATTDLGLGLRSAPLRSVILIVSAVAFFFSIAPVYRLLALGGQPAAADPVRTEGSTALPGHGGGKQ